MRNLNRVILSGNAVADVDTRCTPGGKSIVILRLATNEYWYKGEEKRQTVEYHRVVFFEPYFESAKDITKGMAVYLEGKNKTRKYTGKDGVERYATEVVVNDWHPIAVQTKPDQTRSEQAEPAGTPTGEEPPDFYDDDTPF